MMKNLCLILTILLFIILSHPVRADTIIDSVYATPVLDGYIGYSQQNQGFFVNNWMYDMGAGDIGDNGIAPPLNSDNNSYSRSYISFFLPEIPEGYEVDSVYVRLYQNYSTGNSGFYQTDPQDFPVWDVTGGDTIRCIVSHIDYGNELDVGDWENGDIGNPNTYQHNIGVMTESGEDGYRYLNLTSSVLQDYEINRDKTQYRIAFDGIDTDWDDLYDNVGFKTSNSWVTYHRPQLFFTFYEDTTTDDHCIVVNSNFTYQIFPNPISNSVKILLSIKKECFINLGIFNIKGQKLRSIFNGNIKCTEEIEFSTQNLPSGIYFMRASDGKQAVIKKIVIIH